MSWRLPLMLVTALRWTLSNSSKAMKNRSYNSLPGTALAAALESLQKAQSQLSLLGGRAAELDTQQEKLSPALSTAKQLFSAALAVASFSDETSLREQQQSLMMQIEEDEAALVHWSQLNDLIGSASGDKFRRFAQGLTLDHLVALANRQLDRLHGRYLLQRRASDALELDVIDTWQADAARDTRTLSGGERFLVSLALSDLVSVKTRIESLFLDECLVGTLDAETLDTALDALNAQTIGVISHVEAMKERIQVQIRVHKINGLGYSKLELPRAQEA